MEHLIIKVVCNNVMLQYDSLCQYDTIIVDPKVSTYSTNNCNNQNDTCISQIFHIDDFKG